MDTVERVQTASINSCPLSLTIRRRITGLGEWSVVSQCPLLEHFTFSVCPEGGASDTFWLVPLTAAFSVGVRIFWEFFLPEDRLVFKCALPGNARSLDLKQITF